MTGDRQYDFPLGRLLPDEVGVVGLISLVSLWMDAERVYSSRKSAEEPVLAGGEDF